MGGCDRQLGIIDIIDINDINGINLNCVDFINEGEMKL